MTASIRRREICNNRGERPETWVTDCTGHMGNSFRFGGRLRCHGRNNQKWRRGDDGIWLVTFMHYDLGYIDLEQRTLQTINNPFGANV